MKNDLLRVLIIDDNLEDRRLMRQLLLKGSARHYHFIEAESGKAGLAACHERGEGLPDCILLDYFLPDYDASELLVKLGGPDSTCRPVVVVTGAFSGLDGTSILRMGAQDFISKNWMNPESLTHSVENAIDRFRMMHEIRTRENRLKLAFEVSNTFAFEWERSTDFIWRTDNSHTILRVSLEEAKFNTWEKFLRQVHPDDRNRYICLLSELRPEADTYRTEYRLIRGDGTEAILMESAQGFFDPSGKLQGLVGATRDITEKRRTTLALQKTEQHFRKMAEAVGDVFWLSSPVSQNALYVSPTFEDIWGRKCEELYAHPKLWLESIVPEDLPRVLHSMESLLVDGHYQVDYRITRPDGSVRWISERAYKTSNEDGQFTLTSGVASDITQRKQMEQCIGESEARFRTLFESSSDALMLLFEDQKFIDCNPATLRIFGCTAREEFLGKNPANFSPPTQPGGEDSVALARERVALTLKQGNQRFEWQHCRLDGTEFPAEVLLSRIELQGRPMLQGTVRDITEHKTMLKAMDQAKEAAEASNRAKSAFLANMSHEIRTPMTAIMGMTELCLATNPSEQQRNYLTKIKGASEALLHIIDDILDFSKIEAGKLDIVEEPLTLEIVCEDLASLLLPKAQAKGLKLATLIDPSLAKSVFLGDSLRLGQVLINLIGNAIKFTKTGQVVFSVAEEGRSDGRVTLHFAVRDEGIGIAIAEQARLFKPFSQADASTNRTYGGTGLGLAISRRLVELMGGRIWLDSALGRGSTFHFTACFAVSDRVPAPARHSCKMDGAALARLRGADILLVEDSELNQEVIRDFLQQAGFRVRLAVNGAEALTAVEQALPDCVLMDCQMPVMDGFEATRTLRAQERCRGLPIIALTANTMAGDREQCLATGMDGFVAKPVDFAELYAALVQWVRPRNKTGLTRSAQWDDPQTGGDGVAHPILRRPAQRSIPELPGIDTAKGGYLTGGKWPFYLKLLRMFRNSQANHFQQLFRNAQQASDWATAVRLAHTLKGAANTLGAETLGELAAQLEEASRSHPEAIASLMDAVDKELDHVLKGLAQLD